MQDKLEAVTEKNVLNHSRESFGSLSSTVVIDQSAEDQCPGFAQICMGVLQNEFKDRALKSFVRPVAALIYNEIYPYIWTLCIYNILVFVLLLSNFLLILKLYWIKLSREI